jgi:hypothetical protein
MSFLKKIFGKEEVIQSNDDFWNWFQKNEKDFFASVKQQNNIEKHFFKKLSPKLDQIKEGIYYLTGMSDDNTVELILTAEGTIKNIGFVEELIAAAPKMSGWKFTALKPAMESKDLSIEMADFKFNDETLSFYANDLPEYPDEIDITILHKNWDEENKTPITNGTYIFLDNYLGELDFAITIDTLTVTGTKEAKKEPVPMEKLKDFLKWRQKEFIEKYEGERKNTDSDNYSILEAETKSGKALVAVINTDLLNWDSKASHPWIATAELKYDGSRNNGMPDEQTYQLLDEMENKIVAELKDYDGYLNIGRQTSDGIREIYFACKEFRKPSKILDRVQAAYTGKIDMSYDIYKDKYWRSFERFKQN